MYMGEVTSPGGRQGQELIKNVERDDKDTMRTVVDCVVKLCELRSDLIGGHNDGQAAVTEAQE